MKSILLENSNRYVKNLIDASENVSMGGSYSKFCVEVGSIYVKGAKTNPLVSCGCVGLGMRVCEAQGTKGCLTVWL